jgi:Flp pilus assembly protein TadG
MNRFKEFIERNLKNEGGQALVLVALFAMVLMGFAASVVDVGMVQVAKAKMQNAADAAALAAAKDLPNASTAVGTAKDFAELNGADKLDTIATTPYKGDSATIEVVCTKNVQYTFARVLGFTDTNISARAVAGAAVIGGPFGFTIFSGDPGFELTFNGTNTNIDGSAHSNNKFLMNGTNQKITGLAEAVSSFKMNGTSQTIVGSCQGSSISINGSNISVGNKIYSAAPWIDMPDFSALVQAEAEAAGQVYTGDKTYNGNNINVDSPVYVKGNLTVNSTNFTGKGIVLVSGNIVFNGTNLSSSGSSVCFYSKNGDITINGTNIELHGLVYAPNGTILMNGTNQTVKGRVIGNMVKFNGTNFDIISGTGDLDCLPKSSVKLIE